MDKPIANPRLSRSARLVLRDRTRTDTQDVLIVAIEDLVLLGAWTHDRRRRGLRRIDVLDPAGPKQTLPEPLRFVDAQLRRVPGDEAGRRDLPAVARWFAQNDRRAGTSAVHSTLDGLLEDGFLERTPRTPKAGPALVPTERGRRELDELAQRPAAPRPAGGRAAFADADSWMAAAWTAAYEAARRERAFAEQGASASDSMNILGGG